MAKDREEVIKIMFWLDHFSCISMVLRLRPIIYTMLGISIMGAVVMYIHGAWFFISDRSYELFTSFVIAIMFLVSIAGVIVINL